MIKRAIREMIAVALGKGHRPFVLEYRGGEKGHVIVIPYYTPDKFIPQPFLGDMICKKSKMYPKRTLKCMFND